MKKTLWFYSISLLFLLPILLSFRYEVPLKKPSLFDLIHNERPLKLNLECDLQQLIDNRNTNDYFPATLQFKDNEGQRHKWEAEIRSRGKFRRRICQFPPLKIKFSKTDLQEEGLKKHNEFKLVTHCLDSSEGNNYILREYLVYKLYNLITEMGYRVQLVKATYRDSESSLIKQRYAILLEDEDDLEDRLDGKVCDACFNQPEEEFNLELLHQISLFQFMIGNTDWSVEMLRNLKVLEPKDSSGYLAAPYDFDFSGLVNASYAIPNTDFGMESCRQRMFIGFAEKEAELSATIAHFQSKKAQVLEYVNSFKYLPKSSRKDIVNYLETFYACLEQEAFLNQVVSPGDCE